MNLFQNLIGYTTNDEGYIFEMDITIAKEKEEGKRKPTIEIDEKILQNKPFVDKVVYSKNKRIFESKLLVSNELGYTMNNILNNYETIIKCIRKRKLELDSITEEMEEDNQKSYYDNTTHEYIEEINDPIWLEIFRDLKKDLYKINSEWSPILLIDFYNFEKEIMTDVPKYKRQLEEKINELKKENKLQQNYIDALEKQYNELNTYTYYKNKCIEFITEFVQRLIDIKLYVDNSFPKESAVSNTRRYVQDEEKMTPIKPIFHFVEDGIEEYRYRFTSFEELFYITIEHIVNSWNRVVSRCEYSKCRKYWIPTKSNMIFCQNNECNRKGPDEKYNAKKQKAFLLCQSLIKRLNTRMELCDENEKNYQKILDGINEKYASFSNRPINSWAENKVFEENGEFHKYLTKIDKEFQEKYKSLKGNFKTNKYWCRVR